MAELFFTVGAGDGIRTREYQLGKLGPYHLATPACPALIERRELAFAIITYRPQDAKAFASTRHGHVKQAPPASMRQ